MTPPPHLHSHGHRDADGDAAAATTLALWSAAFAGGASADETLAALAATGLTGARAATGTAAERCGLPGPGQATATDAELLALLRRGGPPRLLLPLPGDVRGLPAGSAALGPALTAGAIVALTGVGVGLVPGDGHWRAYECDVRPDVMDDHDSRVLVADHLRETTARLAALEVASSHGNPRRTVAQRLAATVVPLPPTLPQRASSLLYQAVRLGVIVDVAREHRGAAVTGRELAAVGEALAPLQRAVVEARCAAVGLAVRALHPAAAEAPPTDVVDVGIGAAVSRPTRRSRY